MSEALARVTAALANAEERVGQQQMADLVAAAIADGRHLVVQAGTGTGKTLAYLVPAIEADARVVVATATKALQDQLATKDLPFLAEHVGRDFDWAVLKGRSNYVCLQRLRSGSVQARVFTLKPSLVLASRQTIQLFSPPLLTSILFMGSVSARSLKSG